MLDDESEQRLLDALANEEGFSIKARPHAAVIVCRSQGEVFTFTILDGQQDEALRTFGRYACDTSLPAFGWHQAAQCGKAMKEAFE